MLYTEIMEAKSQLTDAQKFVYEVKKLAKKYGLPVFVVTDGASGTLNNGCEAVGHARDCHVQWELQNGHDPYEDWIKDKK